MGQGMQRRPRIGLLLGSLALRDSFNELAVQSALAFGEQAAIELILVPCETMTKDGARLGATADVFHVALGLELDGIVIHADALASATAEARAYLEAFDERIPIVTTQFAMSKFPVVTIDDQVGLQGVIRHLAKQHQKKKIGYFRGPVGDLYSDRRFQVWRETLQSLGLEAGEALWIQAEWDPSSIAQWVTLLLSQCPDIDAIVANSDCVAIALLTELSSRSIRVPEQVAVVGFDGIRQSEFCTPELTTVYQPMEEEIRLALSLVLSAVRGTPLPNTTTLDTRLEVRQSCGCGHLGDLASKPTRLKSWEESVRTQSHRACHSSDRGEPWKLVLSERDKVESKLLTSFLDLVELVKQIAIHPRAEDLTRVLQQGLVRLGFQSFWLGRFVLPVLRSEILYGVDEGIELVCSLPEAGSGAGSSATAMLPEPWLGSQSQGCFVFMPLLSGERWYGVALLPITDGRRLACQALQGILSSYFDREYQHREETRQRSLSEKMAMVGNLVAGVAHELNTPLGNCITLASYLATEDDLSLQLTEGLGLISRNLSKAAELIGTFKLLAVDQSDDGFRVFGVKSYFEDALLVLGKGLENSGIRVELHCPGDLMVESSPAVFFQILAQLVGNSIAHGFQKRKQGTITITVSLSSEHLRLSYTDNGDGADTSTIEHLFDPFFTTQRSKGRPGLGATILMNLVTQRLQGTLSVTPRTTGGLEFLIILPLGNSVRVVP